MISEDEILSGLFLSYKKIFEDATPAPQRAAYIFVWEVVVSSKKG
jgi:hypothetical protein